MFPIVRAITATHSSNLTPNRAPERHGIGKANVPRSCPFHHCLYLRRRHPVLEPRTEPIERVGSHAVVAATAVGAERPVGDVKTKTAEEFCGARERPINHRGGKLGDDRFQVERRLGDRAAYVVARSPQQPEPGRSGCRKRNRCRRASALQASGSSRNRLVRRMGRVNGGGRQGCSRNPCCRRRAACIERGFVKTYIGLAGEFLLRDRQSLGTRIRTLQVTNPPRHPRGPPAAAATGIETDGSLRKALPREARKILLEQARQFRVGKVLLIEALPFATEIGDCRLIEICVLSAHRSRSSCSMSSIDSWTATSTAERYCAHAGRTASTRSPFAARRSCTLRQQPYPRPRI
jgi:hypothetical protein